MGILKSFGKILAGGQRQKGEHLSDYNSRAHGAYKHDWCIEKKQTGNWLSKEDYKRKTGRPGRKDPY
ncbi:MAG: hypothetical protein KGZ58_00480 [Ignavibacteriales bacterium]|nr:hypothetical protein [Ignavibacteriales bacterium]